MSLEELQEILLAFSYRDEDEKEAHRSFNILYRKFSKTVCSVCKSMLKQMGIFDEELMNTAVNNTFIKIYEAPKLDFTPTVGASVVSSFEAYLAVILRNEIFNLLKGVDKNIRLVDNYIDDKFAEETIETDTNESENMKLLSQILNTFNERDRQIVIALYSFYEEGKKNPSEFLDMLATTYGTTKANIRKIKERKDKEIKDFFAKHSPLKPLK
ncbi:sigma-70 family RNA polymerase sigma factor [Flavobacterium sp. MAH-1]|uniref:Sigma-70 family RNA polymerase sigma factor n=1 Tax=Flavobacterium agri TaxID=2743471 RepID=A0A7Y9C6Q5_9FLAO|nr:sigma-70 family RNA polymerase sigma factor [Flavobacterium agri]NUY80477.1 sigma-70 family RNA polymerase sigma factor [Flavobacterium agri]NYA70502.1 sigma-70 family RNA polymerase sigma factor [Flavobacterium agri]